MENKEKENLNNILETAEDCLQNYGFEGKAANLREYINSINLRNNYEKLREPLVNMLMDFYYGDEHSFEGLPQAKDKAHEYVTWFFKKYFKETEFDIQKQKDEEAKKMLEGI